LGTLGLEDLLGQHATVIVEWGEKLGDNRMTPRVEIHLEHMGSDERRIIVERLEG
ncbi:MAG: tRNA (adenosine(37)-N6)-threonylcarbamoyltransferase complex ATPase subunit type 1 TsaE, partial [Acidobacteria bacterium]|nr:tRNA (adenosine(37)-N6)-threonylcarbamoyltransferase complex ATPase subunit type 1 TsaE [Acidobacteriota bacterium]